MFNDIKERRSIEATTIIGVMGQRR